MKQFFICAGIGILVVAGFSSNSNAQLFATNSPTVLFDGQTLNGWTQIPPDSWTVTNGAIASLGIARGVIYTTNDFSHYRLMFTQRHIFGNKDHKACVLVFCTRPAAGEKPLDALGGIQFQVPNGGHWDYRPGHNNGAPDEFTKLTTNNFNVHEWSRIEILVDATKGTARMAVSQPPGSNAIEVLDFNVPDAGKAGPIALQMHNKGLFDEYKDISVEVNPKEDRLITVGQ
jgi:hypothetical protein